MDRTIAHRDWDNASIPLPEPQKIPADENSKKLKNSNVGTSNLNDSIGEPKVLAKSWWNEGCAVIENCLPLEAGVAGTYNM